MCVRNGLVRYDQTKIYSNQYEIGTFIVIILPWKTMRKNLEKY